MSDGHLNKCINCTKNDTKNKYNEKIKDINFIENERKRGRNKYRRLYVGLSKANIGQIVKYHKKYPEKLICKNLSSNLKKPFAGAERHHWSYEEKNAKDVIWLSKKDHMKAHRFIKYNQESKIYIDKINGTLLDTKEKHEIFIRKCIDNEPD